MPAVPKILDHECSDEAVELLRHYFSQDGAVFTGARFESLGGGGDQAETANVITAGDVVALSMLSIRLHGATSRRLLEDNDLASQVTELLAQVPTDLDLVDAPHEMMSDGSTPDRLWRLLRALTGVGQTTVSKVMARKRPRLIPVYDSVVARAFGLPHSGPQWSFWHEALRANDRKLHEHLLSLRVQAGLSERISALRVLDVVVWMKYRSPAKERDEVEAGDA